MKMSNRGRHLTSERKMRIVQLGESNHNPTEVTRIMQQEGVEGLTRNTVYRILAKWRTHRTVGDIPSPIKPMQGVTNEICDFIDSVMESNDEESAPKLSRKIKDRFGVSFSESKTKELRRRLGWISTKTKYCQMVRNANKEKRADFAKRVLQEKDQFDDVIWTDECNIQLEQNGTLTYHRWWEPCPQKGKPKHPYKVSVWAGISKRGASKILTFEGIMEKTFFCEDILQKTLKPFIDERFPDGHRFMQDNDPKHTSILARETMEKEGINWWKTPAESPDLNPIENFWHELKNHLRMEVKPRTAGELLKGIQDFWLKLTPIRCCRYIHHIQRVLPVVIEREGKATGF